MTSFAYVSNTAVLLTRDHRPLQRSVNALQLLMTSDRWFVIASDSSECTRQQ